MADDGASSRSPTPILFGSAGASTDGTSAHARATARIMELAITSSLGRARVPSAPILRPNARIDQRVRDVDEQVRHVSATAIYNTAAWTTA